MIVVEGRDQVGLVICHHQFDSINHLLNQILQGRFSYGPFDMSVLSGEKVGLTAGGGDVLMFHVRLMST